MLDRIKRFFGIPILPGWDVLADLNGQIAALKKNDELTHRALFRAGELIETLGRGEYSSAGTPQNQELHSLGNAIQRLAGFRMVDTPVEGQLAEMNMDALMTLQKYRDQFNLGFAGSICKTDAEQMIALAEKLYSGDIRPVTH